MQIAAPNLRAHHATLVHIQINKALHQILHAESAAEGRMLQHQAPTNVLTALRGLFAVKLDFLSTPSALWEDTLTSKHNRTAPTARRAAIRNPKARQSALSVRLVLSTVRQDPWTSPIARIVRLASTRPSRALPRASCAARIHTLLVLGGTPSALTAPLV